MRREFSRKALDALTIVRYNLIRCAEKRGQNTIMQNNTFGTLPDHRQLLALIAAHGAPAFLEGVADALNEIASDISDDAPLGASDGPLFDERVACREVAIKIEIELETL